MGEEFFGELTELVGKYVERGMTDAEIQLELDIMIDTLDIEPAEQAA